MQSKYIMKKLHEQAQVFHAENDRENSEPANLLQNYPELFKLVMHVLVNEGFEAAREHDDFWSIQNYTLDDLELSITIDLWDSDTMRTIANENTQPDGVDEDGFPVYDTDIETVYDTIKENIVDIVKDEQNLINIEPA